MKYEIGQKFKHKEFGFVGSLVCVDYHSHLHVIRLIDGKDEVFHTDKGYYTDYAPIIQWKGQSYMIEEKFDVLTPVPLG